MYMFRHLFSLIYFKNIANYEIRSKNKKNKNFHINGFWNDKL